MESGAATAALGREYAERYVANLAALYTADGELAARIDALPFAHVPALEATRDGGVTVRLSADDGKPVYVHSRYEPTKEARTLIDAQWGSAAGVNGLEGPDAAGAPGATPDHADTDASSFVLLGLGLGYHVTELERRCFKPLIIVAEDDVGLIKAALCVTDLATLLRERRLTFVTSADKAAVHERLRGAMAYLMLGLRFITLPHSARYHARFYADFRRLMREFVAYARVQMISLLRHARTTCANVAYNLPHYVAQPGVEVLKGRAAGFPAIVVAAGPSLARNIDQLGELRARAVVIAVQTVFKTLLARGAPPHFVTSLDYHEISAQFFHGVTDFGETILVAEPKATWHVLDAYPARKHVLQSGFAEDILRGAAPPPGALRPGSTVAHLAFYLAEHLGCDPIILVGQDLSFSDGLYYPAGMPIESIWWPELGRFNTVEMKQWERIARFRANLHLVEDIHGRKTYTDDQMHTYAEQFQSDFLASRARVIHATEGGMRLAGTEVMTLAEAARRFCTRPLPPDLFALPAAGCASDLPARVRAAIEQRMAEVREMREIATQTIDLLTRLRAAVDRAHEFNALVIRVDELRDRMQKSGRTYDLVVQVSQLAELRRLQADRAIRDGESETPAMARRRIQRDQEYVAAFVEGCDYLLQLLPQALQRVRERLA